MKKQYFKYGVVAFLTLSSLTACDNWLDTKPYNVVANSDVWNDATVAEGVLANLYDRMNDNAFDEVSMQLTDEAMWSGDRAGMNDTQQISGTQYAYWDYTYIRDLNLFIEKVKVSSLDSKKQLEGEARFLRAFAYFEMVKRYGGVPLVTQSYTYDGSQKVEEYQLPRATEAQVYDFIGKEVDEISSMLSAEKNFRRATKWSALALKSRAMLYAGSLAKYNNQMQSPITLSGGEVGMSASKAQEYYEASWKASQEIINSGLFGTTSDYFNIFDSKNADYMILARDYIAPDYSHYFTIYNTTPSLAQTTNQGAEITPFLEFVESYENLDGTDSHLKCEDANGNPVYYSDYTDIFKGKDTRLAATVLLPGSEFKGVKTSVQAGQKIWNSSTQKYDLKVGMSNGEKDSDGRLIRGFDGPSEDKNITNTGFYIKKFISTNTSAGLLSTKAANYWPIFRYAEILLNAAEAGFELAKPNAIDYINIVREKAGFGPNSLKTLSFKDIIHERKIELAFEGHRYFDLKRWRLAESVINNVQYHGLYPYLVVNPGTAMNGKYIYEKIIPKRLNRLKIFERNNYYTFIPDDAIAKNPKLVKNPGQ